ncbi:MAG: CmpA/NrtA family ABC transporter substrate-binding protein, partial [Pseudomonadota bacterium]
MSTVDAGFIPLVDAAALIVAREMGFATEEGIDLALHRAPSWSSIRDGLATGRLAVAHMLAPVPVAMAMGLGGLSVPLEAPMVLSVNGTVVGVTPRLAARLRDRGALGDFMDARTVGEALIAVAEPPLKVGVPFPFSMHAELLYYWLGSLGMRAPQEMQVRTVPPPLMADAMAAGEIDAFCVGEPWGSMAVERGIGEIVLPGCAIWRFAPEKVLAVRRASGGDEAAILRRLMVALWRAGHWLADPGHQMTAAEILSRAEYLNLPAEVIERS